MPARRVAHRCQRRPEPEVVEALRRVDRARELHGALAVDFARTLREVVVGRARIIEYAQAIAREFQPEKIILFGSYAYGEPTPDSDVDLLVVMRHEGRNAAQATAIRNRLDASFAMDLLVRTPDVVSERLARGDFFLRDVSERGQVLYEAGHR